jgi:DNA polymerase-1
VPADLRTTDGTVTNAVHGFVSMMIYLFQAHHPSGIAVAWDRPERTFRDDVVPEYKANRDAVPDLLSPQFAMVREVLDVLCVACLDLKGYEADDVLATLATRARDEGQDAVVVTGDRDAFQLVEDPHVAVLYTRRGISDTTLYDEAGIIERTGVTPAEYPILAALRGDPSDNLAGVPGVGEKTAAKLVKKYTDLDGIFSHLDEMTPSLRKNLAESEETVRRNYKVIPLVRDAPLAEQPHDLKLGGWDLEKVRAVFEKLELRTAWGRLEPMITSGELTGERIFSASAPADARLPSVQVGPVSVISPTRTELPSVLLELAGSNTPVSVVPVWSGEPGRSGLEGLALAVTDAGDRDSPDGQGGSARPGSSTSPGSSGQADGESQSSHGAHRAVWVDGASIADPAVAKELNDLLARGGPGVVAFQAKELERALLGLGVDMTGLSIDVGVAAYLLDPSTGQYSLETVAETYLGISLDSTPRSTGQLELEISDGESEREDLAGAAGRKAVVAGLLAPVLTKRLSADGLERLHDEIEQPLERVLARMEVAGIAVDTDELRLIAADLRARCKTLEAQIHDLAGEPFNVNSTPQLREVLYDRLGLSPGRRTKTGFSTNAATLERLRGTHPIIDTILSYREVEKLRSTYGESLLAEVGSDGRIHASFNQTVARTGRLSSDKPNLHNIPVRSEEGRRLRRAFVPAPGHLLLVSDYDQIELRVIAHLSGDPGLVKAFAEGRDIHRATAATVFGVPPEEVTFAQRSKAKMVSYGLAYGMESYGLGQRLGIETSEAAEILGSYFAGFPLVREFMDRSVADARSRGYTVTLLGRRRPLPDLNSPNRGLRMAAERQAMNAGIQGLAADLFKVALVRLDAALEEGGLESRLVLQVHDEVLLEVPTGDSSEETAVAELTRSVLAGVGDEIGLAVPLEVSSAWGSSWAEAKDHVSAGEDVAPDW